MAQQSSETSQRCRFASPNASASVCTLESVTFRIPVVVSTQNNLWSAKLLIDQLRRCFNAHVIVVDMGSTSQALREWLAQQVNDTAVQVVWLPNLGARELFGSEDFPVLAKLPRFFAYTDGDVRLPSALPFNFLCVLAALTQLISRPKISLALDLAAPEAIFPQTDYFAKRSIVEWEEGLWKTQLQLHQWPEMDGLLWDGGLDTTFSLYDKGQMPCDAGFIDKPCFTVENKGARVSGIFAAQHRPWYPHLLMQIPPDQFREQFGNVQKPNTVDSMLRRVGLISETGELSPAALDGTRLRRFNEDLSKFYCWGRQHSFPIPTELVQLMEPLPGSYMTSPLFAQYVDTFPMPALRQKLQKRK